MKSDMREINLSCNCKTFNRKDFIKVKKLSKDAMIPEKAHLEDAGFDISSIDNGTPVFADDGHLLYIEYKTGIAIEPPEGYSIEAFPRSSISKYDLILANSIGLIDNPYRGEIKLRFKIVGRPGNNSVPKMIMDNNKKIIISGAKVLNIEEADIILHNNFSLYKKGDKIAQLIIRKDVSNFSMIEVNELGDTSRGSGGFGSSG